MTSFRLLVKQARADWPVLVVMAALVLVTSLVGAAAPRKLNATDDAALRQTVRKAPDEARDVTATGQYVRFDPRGPGSRTDEIDHVREVIRGVMPATLRDSIGESQYAAVSSDYSATLLGRKEPGVTRLVDLRYQSGLPARVHYVEGHAPSGSGEVKLKAGLAAPVAQIVDRLDVALSRSVARTMALRTGDRLLLQPDPTINAAPRPVVLDVIGVFVPRRPRDPFWSDQDRVLDAPRRMVAGDEVYSGAALVPAAAFPRMFAAMAPTSPTYSWRYRVDVSRLDADNVGDLSSAIGRTKTQTAALDLGNLSIAVDSGLNSVLDSYLGQRATARSVIALALVGLLAVALTVIAMTAELAVERRRAAIALVRARGGSLRQSAAALAFETAAVAVPAAALGYGLALLAVPARGSPASAQLAALVAAVTIGLPPLQAWRQQREVATGRRDIAVTRPSPHRLAGEAFVVALAVVGVVVLRRRGLTSPAADAGVDPFLTAVPILLGLAAGVLALRCYPYPLRMLGRAASRRKGAVSFLGLARASRETLASALPLVVLLLGLAMAVFASVVQTTVGSGQQHTAWETAGADTRVDGNGFSAREVTKVDAVPGTEAVTAAYADGSARLVEGGLLTGNAQVLALDPAAYQRLLDGSPLGLEIPAALDLSAAGRGAPVPALLSADLASRGSSLGVALAGAQVPVEPAGSVDSFPGLDPSSPFLVVSLDALRRSAGADLQVNRLYVTGADAEPAALRAAGGGSERFVDVVSRARVYAEIHRAPLVRGTVLAFGVGIAATAAYCALAIVLALVVTARPRGRVLSYLRTLGLKPGQARGLVALELLPLVGVAVVAGVVLGIAIPRVVEPAVDLAPFTGGGEAALDVDPVVTSLLAGGLILLVLLAVVVETAVNRRLRLGSVLRLGEDQ